MAAGADRFVEEWLSESFFFNIQPLTERCSSALKKTRKKRIFRDRPELYVDADFLHKMNAGFEKLVGLFSVKLHDSLPFYRLTGAIVACSSAAVLR